jgi:hypothetical protein
MQTCHAQVTFSSQPTILVIFYGNDIPPIIPLLTHVSMYLEPDPPRPVLPRRSKVSAVEPTAEPKKEFVLKIPAPVLKQTKGKSANLSMLRIFAGLQKLRSGGPGGGRGSR